MLAGVSRKMITCGVAIALCASPALASALLAPAAIPLTAGVSRIPIHSLSPMVALSIFGSQASVMALCGSAISAAAATAQTLPATEPAASVAGQSPVNGCVLPVTDTLPPVASAGEAPPPGVAPFTIFPLLAGLAGIGGTAAAVASQGNGNDNDPPVSVN